MNRVYIRSKVVAKIIDIDTDLSEKLWLSGMGNGKRARTKLQEEKGLFINNNKNNKQKQPHREKQTGKQARLDKAGQGRTGQDRTQGIHSKRHKMTNQPRKLQTQGDLKGSK